MYKNLYDNLAHWYHNNMGTVYFYSDPHFGDDEAKALRKDDISEDEQVKRINSKVGRYDTIVFLGDIGDVKYIRKIRGYKVLVMGNHDKSAVNYKRIKRKIFIAKDGRDSQYNDVLNWAMQNFPNNKITINDGTSELWEVIVDNELFDEVYEGVLTIAPNIILSHEPVGDFPYAINIHGHTHSSNDKYNMCAENINYTPVPIKKFIEDGINKKVIDIHRETIDNATKRKAKKMKAKDLKNQVEQKRCDDDDDSMCHQAYWL